MTSRFNIVGNRGRWCLFYKPADGPQRMLGKVSRTRYGWRTADPDGNVIGFNQSRAQGFRALAQLAGVTERPSCGWSFGATRP